MEILINILLCWLLVALVVLLLLINYSRRFDNIPLEKMDSSKICVILLVSALWPISVISFLVLLIKLVFKWLMKERTFKK